MDSIFKHTTEHSNGFIITEVFELPNTEHGKQLGWTARTLKVTVSQIPGSYSITKEWAYNSECNLKHVYNTKRTKHNGTYQK